MYAKLVCMGCVLSLVESKKGITISQRCTIENQKGAITVQSLVIAPLWFSVERWWTALMTF